MKMNSQKIYERTKLMLLRPNSIWPWILKENLPVKDIFRNYLLPVSLVVSLLVLLLSLFKYSILHSVGIGTALGNIFIGQLFTLLSFIFIRTLYSGIERLPEIPANQKTNILIITSLTIICIPIIISQLLMILFNISAINI